MILQTTKNPESNSFLPHGTDTKPIVSTGVLFMKTGDKEYTKLHHWLRNNYGKAHKCQHPNCTGKSQTFHWALKKGCEYAYDITHFIMLCVSCHVKYDLRLETVEKIADKIRGRKQSIAEIELRRMKNTGKKRSVAFKTLMRNMKLGVKLSEFHKSRLSEAKKGKPSKKRRLNYLQARIIRRLTEIQNKEIASLFKVSTSLIGMIKRFQIYNFD